MKEKIEVFKELLKVPRYNALIKLGMYALFFLVFGLMFSLSTTKKIEKVKTSDRYNFIYRINDFMVSGNYDKKTIITYNETKCEISDTIIPDSCDLEYKELYILFSPERVKNYIKKDNLLYKKEYADGIKEYEYSVLDDKVNSYYNSDLYFTITVKENIYTINLENYNILDKISIEYIY